MLFGEVQRHGRRWECHTHWSKLFSLSVSPSERRIQDIQTASWRIVSHCQSVVADLPGTAIGCRHHCLSERLSQRPRHLRYSSKLHLVLPSSMRFENAVKHAGAFELIQTVCGSSPCHQKQHRCSVPHVTIPQATVPRACALDCRVGCMMADGLFQHMIRRCVQVCLKMKQKRKPGVETERAAITVTKEPF